MNSVAASWVHIVTTCSHKFISESLITRNVIDNLPHYFYFVFEFTMYFVIPSFSYRCYSRIIIDKLGI